jgi:hypothetical protein
VEVLLCATSKKRPAVNAHGRASSAGRYYYPQLIRAR